MPDAMTLATNGDDTQRVVELARIGVVPQESHFDLSEVIALTGWADPNDWAYPDRFLVYRRLTSGVAVGFFY
jgi:hypothetical protein